MSLRDFSAALSDQLPYQIPVNPAFFDPQIAQNSCSVSCFHSLVERITKTDFSENFSAALAEKHGLFDLLRGTSPAGFDEMARLFGLSSSTVDGNTLDALIRHREAGNAVFAHIDGEELYNPALQSLSDKLEGTGHSIEILGLDKANPDLVRIMDPSRGFLSVSRSALEASMSDTKGLATIVNLPSDPQEHAELVNAINESYSEVSDDMVNQFIANKNFTEWGNDMENYIKLQYSQEGFFGSSGDIQEASLNQAHIEEEVLEIDVGNILATGGYMALVEFYKDNPQKAKRITQIAAAAGAFDAFTEFGDGSVSLDFDINPLLVASMAVYLTRYANFSQGSFGARISANAATWVNKGMKIAEYGGYAAAAITAVDFLTGLEATEGILEVLNSVDFLGIIPDVADGVDIVEGLATLGLGIAASRLVRYIFKKLGEDRVKEIALLTKKTGPKKVLAELIAIDAPPELLLGPYIEYRNH